MESLGWDLARAIESQYSEEQERMDVDVENIAAPVQTANVNVVANRNNPTLDDDEIDAVIDNARNVVR